MEYGKKGLRGFYEIFSGDLLDFRGELVNDGSEKKSRPKCPIDVLAYIRFPQSNRPLQFTELQ